MRDLPIISGRICRLAPLDLEDATDRYVGWLNDPDVTRFTEIRPGDATRNSVRAYIDANLADNAAALWRIDFEGAHVGNIRLSGITRHHGRATVALIIGERAARGRGLGADAIESLSLHAFATMGVRKLSAGILAGNAASAKAFRKAGYHHEATLTRHANFEGCETDVELFARFADG